MLLSSFLRSSQLLSSSYPAVNLGLNQGFDRLTVSRVQGTRMQATGARFATAQDLVEALTSGSTGPAVPAPVAVAVERTVDPPGLEQGAAHLLHLLLLSGRTRSIELPRSSLLRDPL